MEHDFFFLLFPKFFSLWNTTKLSNKKKKSVIPFQLQNALQMYIHVEQSLKCKRNIILYASAFSKKFLLRVCQSPFPREPSVYTFRQFYNIQYMTRCKWKKVEKISNPEKTFFENCVHQNMRVQHTRCSEQKKL